MAVTIKNADVIIRLTKERIEKISTEFEQAVGDEAVAIILRTQSGRDVDGQPFAPYDPKYAAYRRKKGRGDTPDLLFTGNMLNAIQTKVESTSSGKKATIYFNSALEAVKARYNQEKRQFFGLSDEQVQRIIKRCEAVK